VEEAVSGEEEGEEEGGTTTLITNKQFPLLPHKNL